MASYSMKDVRHLIWFTESKLDQIMKQKPICQQSKFCQNAESFQWTWMGLSTKENCHWKEMKIAQRQINFHKNVVRAIQS